MTRSGTNAFHGNLFEYNQVSALNANAFFAKRSGTPKSVYRYNQFGGTVGGPIRVPHFFNGQDRLFFFFGYEGIRTTNPNNAFFTVPTDAERMGDFSALLAQGSQYQIYNPYAATSTGGVITRQPYAGNRVPVNAVATKILSFFPEPNVAGGALGQNNYYSRTNNVDGYDNQFARVDWKLNSANNLYFTFRHNEARSTCVAVLRSRRPGSRRYAATHQLGRIGGRHRNFFAYGRRRVPFELHTLRAELTGERRRLQPTTLGFPSTLVVAAGSSAVPPLPAERRQLHFARHHDHDPGCRAL